MISREKDIFTKAIEIEDLHLREAFLDQACQGDMHLRHEVKSLLSSAEHAGAFLETPASVEQFDLDPKSNISDSVVLRFLGPSESDNSLGRIDHFEIESVLGQGGAGLVLKAYDSKLERHVAIKVLSPLVAIQSNARTRFIREAHAAAAISHPHVTSIYAIDEHYELPYLVMEYVEGKTLEQKIRDEGRLGLDPLLRIGAQIARGLEAAHGQGLIHRDIKPANVLLTQGSDSVKITDFGLARAIDDGDITHAGLTSGTPQFMSPEQASGQPLDHRTDLFSLGCVLYAMSVGHSPFKAESAIATIRLLCDETPRAISELNPALPSDTADLIAKLIEKEPDNRYQSAKQIADDLEARLRMLKDPSEATMRAASTSAASSAKQPVVQQNGRKPTLSRTGKTFAAGASVLLALAIISELAGLTGYLTPNSTDQTDLIPQSVQTSRALMGSNQPSSTAALDAQFFETLTSDRYRWTQPINLGEPINSKYDESYPRLSADGLLMVFCSNRPAPSSEALNGDIWIASRTSADAPFDAPVRLGPAINSKRDEHQPSISGDGLILVFARRRQFGAGYELWTSTRESRDSPWTPAAPMGPGFVGPHDFNAFANLSADGLTLDYVSFKPGSGPFIHRRSVRRSTDQPWPDPQDFDLLSDLPKNQLVSYVTIASNDLAVLYRTRDDNVLLVRESIDRNWVTVSMPDEMLTPNNAPGGNAFERHFSADGKTMVYDANWHHHGLGGRDIWMIQRVAH